MIYCKWMVLYMKWVLKQMKPDMMWCDEVRGRQGNHPTTCQRWCETIYTANHWVHYMMPSWIISPHLRHLTLRSSKQRPTPSGNQNTAAKTPSKEYRVSDHCSTGEEIVITHLVNQILSLGHAILVVSISSQDGLEVTLKQYAALSLVARSCILSVSA